MLHPDSGLLAPCERRLPGFAGVIDNAEMMDGTYHVLCVK